MIYDEKPEIIAITKEVVVVKFGDVRIPIYKNDEIFTLSDPCLGTAEDCGAPIGASMTFDEFCSNIEYDDNNEEACFIDDLVYIYGISVIHH